MATGSVTHTISAQQMQTELGFKTYGYLHKLEWTSDASGDVLVKVSTEATIASDSPFDGIMRGLITLVKTAPGTSTPSADWDCYLIDDDASNLDLFQALGEDRSESAPTNFIPSLNNFYVPVNGDVYLKVANAGNAKTGTVWIETTNPLSTL